MCAAAADVPGRDDKRNGTVSSPGTPFKGVQQQSNSAEFNHNELASSKVEALAATVSKQDHEELQKSDTVLPVGLQSLLPPTIFAHQQEVVARYTSLNIKDIDNNNDDEEEEESDKINSLEHAWKMMDHCELLHSIQLEPKHIAEI